MPLSFLPYLGEERPPQTNLSKKGHRLAQAMVKSRDGACLTRGRCSNTCHQASISPSLVPTLFLSPPHPNSDFPKGKANFNSCRHTSVKPPKKRTPVSQWLQVSGVAAHWLGWYHVPLFEQSDLVLMGQPVSHAHSWHWDLRTNQRSCPTRMES